MHRIDLKKYDIRTDMILDLAEKESSILYDKYDTDNIKVSWIKLDDKNILDKAAGTYLTLEFDDITDDDMKKKVSDVFKKELLVMLEKVGYKSSFKTMIIGLGNKNSTPDSLGPLVSEKIIVTNHLYDMGIDVDNNLSRTISFSPGVTGNTGIETSEYILGITKKIKPDLVIIIDALASSSISRVNKSIQVSNVGISPGSGIGNKRKEITSKTLGVPVIAIGIPTVVDAVVIVSDTINYMLKNYAYNKKLSGKKISKFINKPINYLKDKVDVSPEDKKRLLGLVGELNEKELRKLMYEVLTPIGYNMMVTPKEVDFVIEKLSDVISYGVNKSLHKI